MASIFTNVGAEHTSGVLVLLMLGAWLIGFWVGRRRARRAAEDVAGQGKIAEACLAVTGLLLAFSFAAAYTKYEARRQMVVAEANAIGTFAIRANLLPEAAAASVKSDLKEYVRLHLEIVRIKFDRPRQIEIDRRLTALQSSVQDTVLGSLQEPSMRMLAVPLLGSMNQMFDDYEERIATGLDHVPTAVVALLMAVCITSAILLGRSQGLVDKKPLLITLVFLLLVAFIVYVTLDLDQPAHGLSRTSQITMERLARSMGIDVPLAATGER